MILKLLLVIGVIAIFYFMFIKKKPSLSQKQQKQKTQAKTADNVDEMVECTTCGVYVSVEEAILSNGKYYCSRECIVKAK
jgi:uncharacterized protein